MITEHGMADMEDRKRREYLKKSLSELEEVRNVEIIGYLHWSLLDNFDGIKGSGLDSV